MQDIVGSGMVDGVRVVIAAGDDPTVTAGIMFHVGQGDETLATRGLTHLVEHLALYGLDLPDVHHNGTTDDSVTHFYAHGTAEEVAAFLKTVCRNLSDLPLERMDVEKDILRLEAAGRGPSPVYAQRDVRYGAAGPGLVAYRELGLEKINAADVRAWTRQWFTRENAVVWVIAPALPEGLELPLPSASPAFRPVAAESPFTRPAVFFPSGNRVILLDAVVPRSAASAAFARLAARTLFRALRTEAGVSYQADCDYQPIDALRARITLIADALTDQHEAVTHGMVDVLRRLAAGEISLQDNVYPRETREALTSRNAGARRIVGIAMDLLIGAEVRSSQQILDKADEIGVEELRWAAGALLADALLQAPEGVPAPDGFTVIQDPPAERLFGRTGVALDDPNVEMVIAAEGVHWRSATDSITIRYDSLAAYLSWPDGRRLLIGRNGSTINIEPSLYYNIDKAEIALLDERVRSDLIVPMPERDKKEIPHSGKLSGKAFKKAFRTSVVEEMPEPLKEIVSEGSKRWTGFGPWSLWLGILGIPGVVVLLPLAILGTAMIGQPLANGDEITLPMIIRTWASALFSLAWVIFFISAYMRRRKYRKSVESGRTDAPPAG